MPTPDPADPADPDAPVQQARAGFAAPIGRPRSVGLRRLREGGVMAFLGASGLFTLLTTVAIIAILSRETYRFFQYHELAIRDVEPGRPLAGTFLRAGGEDQFRLDPSLAGEVGFVTREQFEAVRSAGGDVVASRAALGLPAGAAIPARLVTVYPGDQVRLPAGEGGADEYEAFGVEAVALAALTIDGGPTPTAEPVAASVWHDVVSVRGFLTGLTWSPLLGSEHTFGILPLVAGTLLVTAIAMAVALPLGLVTAVYLSEYAPRRVRSFLKPTLEIIAGVPTVVFGFFALTVITPGLRSIYGGFGVYNAASAGIAVGILTLPIVTSLIEDALRAVPRSLREASYGLGATRVETSLKVVVPAALSGIVAAALLAIARAVGETMIVALAAGATPLPLATDPLAALNPASEIQPMTGYMVQIFLGDASNFGPEYLSSYAVAATLFVMTLVLTIVGHQVRVRYTQSYE